MPERRCREEERGEKNANDDVSQRAFAHSITLESKHARLTGKKAIFQTSHHLALINEMRAQRKTHANCSGFGNEAKGC
jgi:hypothetical protein